MTEDVARGRVLVLTVGTGHADELERSLVRPILKSVDRGEWRRVVLLPSLTTEASAHLLRGRISDDVDIRPLPKPGQENNADACFGHFDEVLGGLVREGFPPDRIVVDFTRGTKAMSAALVLAAVRSEVPVLRYIYGERRDQRGTVVAGTEKIGEIRTSIVTARRRLDLAADLMRHGNFGAVLATVPDTDAPFGRLWPPPLWNEAAALRAAAEAYAAWDRLDYCGASAALKRPGAAGDALPETFRPDDGIRKWLVVLACEPERSDTRAYAAWLRALACDLLANAERRVRDRHLEDALLRTYRILELIGQCRLFRYGIDSSCVPDDHPAVVKLRKKLRKKGSQDFGRDPKSGCLTAPRNLTARLLKELGDPLAGRLLTFDTQHEEAKTRRRNQSILVHGFAAQAPAEQKLLRRVLKNLERLLMDDDEAAAGRLARARRLDFKRVV